MISIVTYRGRIQDGVVVFEGSEKPAEGTAVVIEPLATAKDQLNDEHLLKWAGAIEGFPADSSLNLDHYLYGHPKK